MRYGLNRREALKLIGGAVGSLPVVKLAEGINLMQGVTAPRNAPNFIFILTDDQQQAAMSAYGNKTLKTPNMDRQVYLSRFGCMGGVGCPY